MTTAVRALFSACLLVTLSACATGGRVTPPSAAPPAGAPLTATLGTTSGTWAIIPMGRLGDRANTFWQLFVLAENTGTWSLVTPVGVADNGGLVAAGTSSTKLVAGFRPSENLSFSPLATTTDNGKTYQADLLTAGLADLPDALATSVGGRAAAVVDDGKTLVSRIATGGSWGRAADLDSLAASAAGRACGVQGLTAVAVAGTGTYLGLTCRRPGSVGIVQLDGSSIQPVAMTASAALVGQQVQVLRLLASGTGLISLLRLSSDGRTGYAVARSSAHQPKWTLSPTVAAQGPLISTAVTASGAVAILTGTPTSGLSLALLQPGAPTWTTLPAPPAATVTVAVSGRRVDALTVDAARFTDYTLDTTGSHWEQTQTIDVPISFDSSH